ncbi:MAG: hypothetical protein V4564_12175 [Pseudomonadota bacterium]|nr:hypothetical protein [Sphingomonas sp. ERG5]
MPITRAYRHHRMAVIRPMNGDVPGGFKIIRKGLDSVREYFKN